MISELIQSSIDSKNQLSDRVYRRQFAACLACRKKKIKCHMQNDIKKCSRCVRQHLECVILPRKPYVWKNKQNEKTDDKSSLLKVIDQSKTDKVHLLAKNNIINCTNSSNNASSVMKTAVSDLRTKKQDVFLEDNGTECNGTNNTKTVKTTATSNPPIITTHGALAFLTNAANNPDNLSKKEARIDQSKITNRKMEPFGYWELDMTIADNQFQQPDAKLAGKPLSEIYASIVLTLPFLKGLLDINEMETLVDVFFLTQHPFYPFVPIHLKSLEQLSKLPLLLLTILTISTRYQNGKERDYEKIHYTLWDNCQQMLSKTVWASVDSFGSLGTIFAFLLFTEWNPRSIHSKIGDYASISNANSTNKEFESLQRSENLSFMLSGSAIRLANSLGIATKTGNLLLALQITELNVTMNFNLNNNLNILKVESRNNNSFNKDYESELEIAKKYVLNGNNQTLKRWQEFTKKLNASDEITTSLLISFWQDEKLLFYKHKSVFNNGMMYSSGRSYVSTGKRILFLDRWQRAKFKMLEIIKLSYETLYYSSIANNYEEPFYSNPTSFTSISTHSLDMNDCINFLKFLQIIINNWYEQFEDLMKPLDPSKDRLVVNAKNLKNEAYVLSQTEKRRGEWFIIDFHYCKIYAFAVVLEFFHKKKNIILHHSNMQLIDYLKDCYISCQYIHESSLRIMKAELLPYLPIRLIGKIIRTIAFLVKMYIYFQQIKKFKILESKKLLINLKFVKIEEILFMIKNMAKCLKKTAPDTSHLGLHYGKIVSFLYEKIAKKENISLSPDDEDEEKPMKFNNQQQSINSDLNNPQETASAKDDMFDILFNFQELDSSGFTSSLFKHQNNGDSFSEQKDSPDPLFGPNTPRNKGSGINGISDRPISTSHHTYNVIDDILGLNYESDGNGLKRRDSVVAANADLLSYNTTTEIDSINRLHDQDTTPSNTNSNGNIISSVSIFDVFGDII